MLTQKTAASIHNCHEQIARAEKLLIETKKTVEQTEHYAIRDAFGRDARTLQLGVPHGSNGHQILNVDFELASIIIEAQIEKYKIQLKALNELCAMECATDLN